MNKCEEAQKLKVVPGIHHHSSSILEQIHQPPAVASIFISCRSFTFNSRSFDWFSLARHHVFFQFDQVRVRPKSKRPTSSELILIRSMTRVQRAPKRATTPTSATFSPTEAAFQPPAPQSPPTPSIPKPLYLSSPFVDAALVKGNFKTIVMLPKYVDIMEWVAMNSACTLFVAWPRCD